ncbi:MAG TPA: Panacea domain-containing protein [Longimicrobiales bacterium]|nr:Panacea domain-containing protein [Longimicrobiales bacterium]
MALRFDEKKTTQAAARLLHREGGEMNVLKLVKLLYLTDRSALLRWGRPISFDWYFALPHGPVLSFTLNKINEPVPPEGPSYWHRIISERDGHAVRLLTANPPDDELSPAEESLLDEVYEEFGGMDQWGLRDLTHELPEWQDPEGSRIRIAIRDILMSEGMSEGDATEIERELDAESRFAQRFRA